MFQLRAFIPASDKVRQVEFHPVQPWVVSATKSDHISIWDWSNEQVLHDFQLGSGEDDMLLDVDLSRPYSKDPVFQINPSLSGSNTSRGSTGHVKDVRFLDTDVAQTQLTLQHQLVNGTSNPAPNATGIRALKGRSCMMHIGKEYMQQTNVLCSQPVSCSTNSTCALIWLPISDAQCKELTPRLLLVVCENKVLLHDLLSKSTSELSKVALEGRSAHCVSFLFQGGAAMNSNSAGVMSTPAMAFGCNDGVVRLVQYGSWRLLARLVSSHKSPVNSVMTLGVRGTQWEQVVAGHQAGSVAVWEPFARHLSADIPIKMDTKAHDKDIVGMALVAVQEDPETLGKLLFTAGVDNRLVGWEPTNLKETVKFKLDPKANTTALAYWPRAAPSSGANVLLVGTEVGFLLSVHPSNGTIRMVCNLTGMIPSGAKKQPKIYWISVHPLQPQFVVLGTNAGSVLLVQPQLPPLATAPLPLKAPQQALIRTGGGGVVSSGATYITVIGDSVYCVSCQVATPLRQLVDDSLWQPPTIQLMGKLQIASGKPICRAAVSVSYDGSYIAVAWPSVRQYSIYRQGATSWEEVTSGSGSSIAWHSSELRFAVLEEPAAPGSSLPVPAKSSKGSKKKEREAVEARRAAEASAPMSGVAHVQVLEVKGKSVSTSICSLDAGGEQPVYVHSGPLLAVTSKKALSSSGLAAGEEPAAVQFFAWDSGRRVGPRLPEPVVIAWDPSLCFCALAYSSQVLVCTVSPTFAVVASLAVGGVGCLEWSLRQLYMVTLTHIHLAFLSPPAGESPPFVHVVILASFTNGISPAGPGLRLTPADMALPPPAARPPGPLMLLGPRDGFLWLVNVHAQPLAVPLSHPGLRCYSLAASGDLASAMQLAVLAVAPAHHDELATFLSDLDPQQGAMLAVGLPGLSLELELALRMRTRQWTQALEALEALLAGHKRRPPPGTFKYTAAAAAFGKAATSGGGAAQSTDHAEGYVDLSYVSTSSSAAGLAHSDDLDWTLPLRQAGASIAAPIAAAAAAANRASVAAVASSAGDISRATDLALQLMRTLLSFGLHDVAKHAARLVLKRAGSLDAGHMFQLASLMCEIGMKQDLPQLMHQTVPGAEAMAKESAGLMAALLSGNTPITHDVLKQSNAPALAAIQATSYQLSTAAASQMQWMQALQDSTRSAASAGHPTAYYTLAVKS